MSETICRCKVCGGQIEPNHLTEEMQASGVTFAAWVHIEEGFDELDDGHEACPVIG